MTTRKEIIAQIADELGRLTRARDFLAAALKASPNGSKIVLPPRVKTKIAAPKRKQPATAVASVKDELQSQTAVAPPPAPVKVEPQVKRVPPRRRMERRQVHTERALKPTAALSGAVPSGIVVVSAVEARKVQERVVAAPPPVPVAAELRPETPGERTLGSLIQAFERRAGLSGLETP